MMWGHLKATDFINLIEGIELPLKLRAHLQSCAQCTEAFVSAQNLHSEVFKSAMSDEDIPEPDWFQFRADVRNTMLSRAAQRQSRGFSWVGWITRPALSWGLAVAFAAGVSSGLMMWNRPVENSTAAIQKDYSAAESGNTQSDQDAQQLASLDRSDGDDGPVDFSNVNVGLTPMDQYSIFDEISQLSDAQVEKLQMLLDKDTGSATRQ